MKKPNPGMHEHLRAWREYRGLTLEKVAANIGIRTNTLSDKELGKRPVSLEELRKLAKEYHCAPWMLLAAPPESDRLKSLQRAVSVIEGLPQDQADMWLGIGEKLNPSKP